MPLSLSELVQNVVDITDRGENPIAIQLAIVKATLKAHLADLWQRDMVEKKFAPDVVEGQRMQVFVSTHLPGMRKISYIVGYDDETDPENPVEMYEYLENQPGRTKDIYGYRIPNVYYLAGDVLTVWTNGGIPPKLLVGYWGLPNVAADTYRSWIADMYPPIIVDEACAEIFGAVGDDDEARKRREMFTGNLQVIRMQEVEVTGR